MVKAILFLALLPAAVASADGQIGATLKRLGDGTTSVTVKNNSTSDMTAFALSAILINESETAPDDSRHMEYRPYHDTVVDAGVEPLAPGHEQTLGPLFVTCAPMPVKAPASSDHEHRGRDVERRRQLLCRLEQPVVAAIFEDGSTSGDANLVAMLLLRRSNRLLAVDTALDTLADAGSRNVPREELIKRFRTMAESLNRFYVWDEQQVGRPIYQSLVAKLMSLPEAPLGTAFPPSDFVAQETTVLNHQRAVLLRSRPNLAEIAANRRR